MTSIPTPLPSHEIDRRIDHHPPDEFKVKQHEEWRAAVKTLFHTANILLPVGSEQAFVFTHLEEALMWGNAAIARAGLHRFE